MQATIAAGGFWSPSRRLRAGLSTEGCWRCGAKAEVADDLHSFWTCPAFTTSDERHIKESHHLVGTACRMEHPCLWLRGLLPRKWSTFDVSSDKTVLVEFLNGGVASAKLVGSATNCLSEEMVGRLLPPEAAGIINVATDGSGGKSTEDRRVMC